LMAHLEDDEVTLLGLLAQGYTCEEIGSMQGVSMQAVSKQRARLQEKARRIWNGGI
jgi:DNA-binding CsgD family transcriptional regulator